jgi:hypothetical protein
VPSVVHLKNDFSHQFLNFDSKETKPHHPQQSRGQRIENRKNDTKEESGTIAPILPQLSPPDAVVASTAPAHKNSPYI